AALRDLGISLPPATAAVGSYQPFVRTGRLVFVSGHIAKRDGTAWAGSGGAAVPPEEGTSGARRRARRLLRTLRAAVGDLDRGRRIVRVTVLVNSAPGFTEQHLVANGATDLFAQVFGLDAAPVRTSFGVAQLPMGACVEIDLVAEVD